MAITIRGSGITNTELAKDTIMDENINPAAAITVSKIHYTIPTGQDIKAIYEKEPKAFTDDQFTKLGGIEDLATADQTASEILTLIRTVDGSGSGLDADTLDGISSEAFALATDSHAHNNKSTLDKFGESEAGLPTYNGVDVDTTIAQRDVFDGLTSTDNTISLAAKQGKVLDDKKLNKTGGTVTGSTNFTGALKWKGDQVATQKSLATVATSGSYNDLSNKPNSGVEVGSSATPPSSRDKGHMYLTTNGQLYVYIA